MNALLSLTQHVKEQQALFAVSNHFSLLSKHRSEGNGWEKGYEAGDVVTLNLWCARISKLCKLKISADREVLWRARGREIENFAGVAISLKAMKFSASDEKLIFRIFCTRRIHEASFFVSLRRVRIRPTTVFCGNSALLMKWEFIKNSNETRTTERWKRWTERAASPILPASKPRPTPVHAHRMKAEPNDKIILPQNEIDGVRHPPVSDIYRQTIFYLRSPFESYNKVCALRIENKRMNARRHNIRNGNFRAENSDERKLHAEYKSMNYERRQ